MKLVLHVCCGPCTVYPLAVLRQQGMEVKGFFHNPNIHPFKEFRRRIVALEEFAAREKMAVEIDRQYGLRHYLRQVVFREDDRCRQCYRMRLIATAEYALELGADAFSSTLLYSRYQNHELIRELGEEIGRQYGVSFHYDDFRQGWQEGIDKTIAMGIYRQPYCGCVYSEQERYDKRFKG